MKKLLALVLAVSLCMGTLCAVSCAEEDSGTIMSGDWEYQILADNTVRITGYRGNEENLTIPEKLDGWKVTEIGDRAFGDNNSLRSIRIPDSVTGIGANPFYECMFLASLEVSPFHPTLTLIDGVLYSRPDKRLVCCPRKLGKTRHTIPNETESIGDYAFCYCTSLTDVVLPDSLTGIGEYAFMACTDLKGITIPDSMTCIGTRAFDSCYELRTITIPNSVTSIGANPFSCCTGLTTIDVSPYHPYLAVTDNALLSKPDQRLVSYLCSSAQTTYSIPAGTRIIGGFAFLQCYDLKGVSIPDGVTEIGEYAFMSCDALTDITIPDSVTTIGEDAFYWCKQLTATVGKDSCAREYCGKNSISYVIREDSSPKEEPSKESVQQHEPREERAPQDEACGEYSPVPEVRAYDTVIFGTYPQTEGGDDKTPIEWIVLEVKDGKALLLSRYGLDAIPYHEEWWEEITWEYCSLRAWLNGNFLDTAFTPAEQAAILVTDVDNSAGQGCEKWKATGGRDTRDRVFLLSVAEAVRYYGVKREYPGSADEYNIPACCAPTAYALARGAYTSLHNRQTADGKMSGIWWLRSPGDAQHCAADILDNGEFFYYVAANTDALVRPALWVDLSMIR